MIDGKMVQVNVFNNVPNKILRLPNKDTCPFFPRVVDENSENSGCPDYFLHRKLIIDDTGFSKRWPPRFQKRIFIKLNF